MSFHYHIDCHEPGSRETYEPRHDKTSKMAVRPVKIQISLDIRTV